MAILEKIDLTGPVILDPTQYDLDRNNTVVGVSGVDSITLAGTDATVFFAWVSDFWRRDFEKNLQSLSSDREHGDLLTTWLPLVTFREELCLYGAPREHEPTATLLDKLRTLTRYWRDHGVDSVYISGVDLSSKSVKEAV